MPKTTPEITSNPRKLAFITIGATASFQSLLHAALSPNFLSRLASHGYNDLLVQYGTDRELFNDLLSEQTSSRRISDPPDEGLVIADAYETESGVRVLGFAFNKKGLQTEMRAAAGRYRHWSKEGCVISHAGKVSSNFLKHLSGYSKLDTNRIPISMPSRLRHDPRCNASLGSTDRSPESDPS